MKSNKTCSNCGTSKFLARGRDKCLNCLTKKGGGASIVIGIDVGAKTGYAVWNIETQDFEEIQTLKIHQALDSVLEYHKLYGDRLFVRFEDARLRKWFGDSGREKLQGAGSIKRDSVIWEDFLKDNQINHEAVAPKNNSTKLSKEQFEKITKYTGRTSEHARDAGMLVFKYK